MFHIAGKVFKYYSGFIFFLNVIERDSGYLNHLISKYERSSGVLQGVRMNENVFVCVKQ